VLLAGWELRAGDRLRKVGRGGLGREADHGAVDVHAHRPVRSGLPGGGIDAREQVRARRREVEDAHLVDLAPVPTLANGLGSPQAELRIPQGLYACACRGSFSVGKSPNTFSRSPPWRSALISAVFPALASSEA